MNYFRRLIDENDPANIKRFTVLIALALYTVTNIMALFLNRELLNSNMLDKFIEFNFYIICVGVFGMAIDKVADILLERAKTAAAAQILTPPATVNTVENVQGDIKGNQTIPSSDQPEGDPAYDLKAIKKGLTNSLKPKKEIIG